MMSRLVALWKVFDGHIAWQFVERWSALMAVAWGLWLFLPDDLIGTTASFAVLDALGPEWAWGAIPVAIGIGQLLVMRFRAHPHTFREFAMAVNLTWWVFLMVTIFLSQPIATGVPVYGFISFLIGRALAGMRHEP